jgi:hypothetical protein
MPRRPQYEMNLAMFDEEDWSFTSLPGHVKTLLFSNTAAGAEIWANHWRAPWEIPCCHPLMLMFYNSNEDEEEEMDPEVQGETYGNMKEALWGTVKVTLEETSGLEGNHWFVSHHDVNLVGPLPPFPRGVVVRGDRIEKTLLLFKPKLTVGPPYGVDPSARSYRMHFSGSIKGSPIYGSVNVRFIHHGDNGFHHPPNETANCQGVAALGRGYFLTEIRDLSLSNAPPSNMVYQECNDDASGRQRMELRNNIWSHFF